LGLTFPLLSDFNREVLPLYGALEAEVMGLKNIARRSVFVVDKQGMVRYRRLADSPAQLPENEEILKALEGLVEGGH